MRTKARCRVTKKRWFSVGKKLIVGFNEEMYDELVG